MTASQETKSISPFDAGAHGGTAVAYSLGQPVVGAPNAFGNSGGYSINDLYWNGAHNDGNFGAAVAAGDSFYAVGQPGQNGGEVYWHTSNAESWLMAPGAIGGRFGAALAASGMDLIAGAPFDGKGTAYGYHLTVDGNVTGPVQFAPASLAAGAQYGTAVALGPTTAAVGAPNDSAGGTVHVFEQVNAVWSEVFVVNGQSQGLITLGNALALDGDTLVAGAWRTAVQGNSEAGAALVIGRKNGTWQVDQKLVSGDADANDHFGRSVAVLGSRVVVGANVDDEAGLDSGAVYGFGRVGGVWTQTMKVMASDAAPSDFFGTAVALSPSKLLVGAWGVDQGGTDGGAYYQYVLSNDLGEACNADADCGSGFCVDGVCCNTACGGGVANDCQACSVALGAATNGTCGPATGNTCDDQNACTTVDVCQAGTCTGTSPVTCQAPDECHDAGACDPNQGTCSSIAKADGTPCSIGACLGGNCEAAPTTSSSVSSSSATTSSSSTGVGGGGGAGTSGSTSASTSASGAGGATTTSTASGDSSTASVTSASASGSGGAGGSTSHDSQNDTTGCTISPVSRGPNGTIGVLAAAAALAVGARRRRTALG